MLTTLRSWDQLFLVALDSSVLSLVYCICSVKTFFFYLVWLINSPILSAIFSCQAWTKHCIESDNCYFQWCYSVVGKVFYWENHICWENTLAFTVVESIRVNSNDRIFNILLLTVNFKLTWISLLQCNVKVSFLQ